MPIYSCSSVVVTLTASNWYVRLTLRTDVIRSWKHPVNRSLLLSKDIPQRHVQAYELPFWKRLLASIYPANMEEEPSL
jgi:hypothetical protein